MTKKILSLAAMFAALLSGCNNCPECNKSDDAQIVDISGAAKTALPLKNFVSTEKIREFGGMKFVLPEGGKNGVFAAGDNAEVDTSKSLSKSGKYVFLLHATGGEKDKGGRMIVNYLDGRRKVFWVKAGRDIAAIDQPAQILDNGLPVYVDDQKSKTGVLYLTRFDAGGASASPIKSIVFDPEGKWYVAGITVSSSETPTTQNYVFDPKVWKVLDTEDLEIKSGSALDVSSMMTPSPCGVWGRVVIGKTGKFEFEKRPNVPVRFKGTNLRLANRFPVKGEKVDPSAPRVTGDLVRTHADIDAYVNILKKQGYNAVRWRPAMRGICEFESPYKMRPEIQDMYDYYIYALKREGIYIFYYLCSNDDGRPDFKWDDRGTIKIKMMLGDKETRNNWRKLAKMQLEHVNPYTKMALKDDPVVATLEYWNEFEIGAENFLSLTSEGRELLVKKFVEFCKKKYGTIEKFFAHNKTWNQSVPAKSFEDLDLSIYANRETPAYAHFVIKSMENTQRFWENVIRKEIGAKMPIHQNNCNKRLYWGYIAAEGGSYQAVNTYHCHPSSYLIGGIVPSDSEFLSEGSFWRCTVNRKTVGMPMAVTEYQHCHFNPYKHEAGLTFPAYSAFQDYDALMVFDAAVAPKGGELGFFNVAENPIYRANDFMNFFMFYRGDVKVSPHRADYYCDNNVISDGTRIIHHSSAQRPLTKAAAKLDRRFTDPTMASLLTGFAFNYPKARRIDELKSVERTRADINISPMVDFDLKAFVSELRAKGILDAKNITDVDKRIYQNDTNEIVMRAAEKLMKVMTPKTEAITLTSAVKDEKLGALTIHSSTVDAAIAVSSIDNKPISQSDRLVLTVSTDAVMKDFGVSKNRLYVSAWGEMPVLIETGKISADLRLSPDKKYSVYALKMNGERLEKIPMKVENGVMKLDLDTSKHVAVFFEIVAE